MTIQDLIEQFEIQGMFHIKVWKDEFSDYETLVKGGDFECDKCHIDKEIMEKRIAYMYAVDGILNIEVELE